MNLMICCLDMSKIMVRGMFIDAMRRVFTGVCADRGVDIAVFLNRT